jgi:predicted  nucleic acid-binding Zn-ribbon protein
MHIETYSRKVSVERKKREVTRAEEGKVIQRKLTVEEICAEAARSEGSHPHVADPKQPVLLFGISPDEIPALLEDRIEGANKAIREEKASLPRGSKAKGPKSIRADTPVLVTFVVSHPIPWRDDETGKPNFEDSDNRALLERWEAANLAWAQFKGGELGFELVSCVRHVDEGHPHLHLFGIPNPEIHKRMEARNCHPGWIAKAELVQKEGEDGKGFKRRQNRANNNAMRAFQDDYYQHVGKDVGLLRIGPKRRRTPHAVYKAEKTAARALGLANVRSDELTNEIASKEADLNEAQALADAVGNDTVQAITDAETFKFELEQIQLQLTAKKEELERLESLGNDLQTVEEELSTARASLEEARKIRLKEEAEIAALRDAVTKEQAELARQRDELQTQFDDFSDAKRTHDRTVQDQRTELDRREEQIETLIVGIEAYADGRLEFRPDDQAKPFLFKPGKDAGAVALGSQLAAMKTRLEPIIRRLDERLSRQAMSLAIEALPDRGIIRAL